MFSIYMLWQKSVAVVKDSAIASSRVDEDLDSGSSSVKGVLYETDNDVLKVGDDDRRMKLCCEMSG